MACAATNTFRLDPTTTPITVGTEFANLCKATGVVERLHKEFTEKYVDTDVVSTIKHTPSFHLRNQLTSLLLLEDGTTAPTNRFYTVFTTKNERNPSYNGVVNAILKGDYDTTTSDYKTYPASISSLKNFDANFNAPTSANFKGVYGLHKVTEILENEIKKKIVSSNFELGSVNVNNNISDFNKYQKRQGIKTTIEEIAHRENELYREKVLNIILIIAGIFIVSTQLVNKYFSFGDGGGGGGSGGFGFGGVGGWLSTRFGSGSSGLFSRFGGIGLGSSGRSRVGNLFTRGPYASSTR
jgi:hypothetical protein